MSTGSTIRRLCIASLTGQVIWVAAIAANSSSSPASSATGVEP